MRGMNINNGPAIRENLTVTLHYRNNGARPFEEFFEKLVIGHMAKWQTQLT